MGTRGLLGFVADGQLKAAYNHFDSYPAGLGSDVLAFVRQIVVTDGAVDIAAQRVRDLRVVTDETPVTDSDIEALKPWTNTRVGIGAGGRPSWYQLLRETQGDPGAILSSGHLEDGSDFALSSLHCEWGYVIDFDTRTLEVYRGFQQKPPTAGRWVGQADEEGMAEGRARLGQVYYPINRVAAFAFDALPELDAFVAQVSHDGDE